MAVNLISSEDISIQQTGSDIDLHLTGKTGDLVVDSIRTKNIFNKANILNNTYLNISNQNKLVYDSNSISGYAKCKPNTTYTISKIVSAPFIVATCSTTPAIDTTIQQGINSDSSSSITITTNSSAQYIVFWFYHAQYSTESYNDIINSIQVEEGSTATTYKSYQNLNGYDYYSNVEQQIGYWIDGKPLYRKVINAGNKPTDATINVSNVVSNLDTLVRISGTAYNATFNQYYNIPNSHNDMSKWYLNAILVNKTNLQIRGGDGWNNAGGLTNIYVVLEYTKTTD